jgi:hypothetical protein
MKWLSVCGATPLQTTGHMELSEITNSGKIKQKSPIQVKLNFDQTHEGTRSSVKGTRLSVKVPVIMPPTVNDNT